MSSNQKMYDRFSSDVMHMIIFAKAASIDAHVDCMYPESFLIGTLLTGKNAVTVSLSEQGVDIKKCVERLKHLLANKQGSTSKGISYDKVDISKEIILVCKKANEISLQHQHKIVGLGHLFIAIMELHLDLRRLFSKSTDSTTLITAINMLKLSCKRRL